MACVICNRPKRIDLEDSEKFICWYCKASRVASSAKLLLDILDEEEYDPVELERRVDLLKKEMDGWHYSGLTLNQLEKPIKGLE